MDEDQQLLSQFAAEGSQAALAKVVRRHMDMVYSAALRRTNGSSHVAADVTQKVFVSLAQNARKLRHHPALVAWLHTATRNAAISEMKAESRRRHCESAAASDPASAPSPSPEWSALKPVLDEAIDSLAESDRAAIILRYFEQVSFREVAAALQLSEDAARMRTDRALQKLRHALIKRGVSSTAAALGLAISQQAMVATPAAVAASVTAHACITAPASLGIIGFLFMPKVILPLTSGLVAAGLTTTAWVFAGPGITSSELNTLRSENERLTLATGPSATSTSLEAIAREYTSGTEVLAQRVREKNQAKRLEQTPLGASSKAPASEKAQTTTHRDRGNATVQDAVFTFAWATDCADATAIAKLLWLDPDVRQKALAAMAKQPAELVAQYPTPESFYGFITAAVCLQAPPPGADVIEQALANAQPQVLQPGRVKFPNKHEYQQTPDGWKFVLPEVAVEKWLHVLGDSVLTTPSAEHRS